METAHDIIGLNRSFMRSGKPGNNKEQRVVAYLGITHGRDCH